MEFSKKMQQLLFWKNVVKVALPFFIMVTILSLILSNSSTIFTGNFKAVYNTNFAHGKWIRFWGLKAIVSIFYGIWITNKRMT